MKKLKGLTLLELITALAITAILLPVVSMVFYNILTTPPEQTARLTLNDEVALLATWLYNDTHRADSLTVGNGSPVYGNFSWTDYSQLNAEGGYNEYLISYYSSCPPGGDPDCSNSVVRQVFLINGSLVWPTATPTSTATATPTPTSTEIPDEQTYTYCSGGGTDKWAWARAWNNTEWFTQGHPANPDDFFDDYDREIETAGSSDYALICTANNQSWSEPDTESPIDYGVSSQLYTIDVAQDRDEVSNLGVTWRGYGGIATQNVKLEIWNYTTSAWTSIIDESDPDSRNNDTYTWDTSSSPENYIEESTGYVTMLASADADETIPGEFNFGNSLYFNGSASNTMTANSSVPTDTFTFEAWVKCTEEHGIDAALSQYGGTSGQHYVFDPNQSSSDAGAGLSVGTNGISVYEYGDDYMPAVAVYEGNLGTAWNHIAVVYDSKSPTIYLNGNMVEQVSTATIDASWAADRGTVYAPHIIGGETAGEYGYFTGWIDEVRIWNIALNQSQIQDNMYTENPTAAGTATVTEIYTSNDYFEPPDGVTEVEVLAVGGGGGGGGSVYGGPTGNGMGGGGGGAGGVVYNSSYELSTITQVEIFTSSDSWIAPDDVTSVEVLVVGGGGGGGGFSSGSVGGGGGGGGGGFRTDDDYSVTPGETYTITVGAGGTAGYDGADGGNGGSSSFDSFTSAGGGGGASSGVADNDGNAGASGGGGRRGGGGYGAGGAGNTPSTSPVQGYAGGDGGHTTGDGSGGGGGASEVGERLDTAVGGAGGDGAASSITGTSVYYAGGGGGGGQSDAGGAGGLGGGASAFASRCAGVPGTNGLGGGGSGATGSGSGDAYSGGAGGSGIVIIKYTSSRLAVNVGGGGAGGTATVCMGAQGSDGSPSVFGDIIAYGGGGGGGGSSINQLTTCVGRDGGSGGGGGAGSYQINSDNQTTAGGSGTAGQGSDGGDGNYDCCMGFWCGCPYNSAGGGGGGADAAGGTAVDTIAGSGGAGDDYSDYFGAVGGASGWFGGGGGGGAYPGYTAGTGGSGGGAAGGVGNTDASNGTASTGGGGGGAGSDDSPTYKPGGNGGSGVVIVQYEVPGANLVGLWHFNDCYVDILDDVMEDSSTYDNDGALSSPGPECSLGVSSDLTLYTDYIALDVTTPGEPVPTVEPRPTDSYPTSTYTPQAAADTCCILGDNSITSPTDTCTGCIAQSGWVAASSGEITSISTDNDVRWSTGLTSIRYERNFQRYQITINEKVSDVTQLDLLWQGYGCQNSDYDPITRASIYNYGGATWETIGTGTDVNSEVTWTKSISSGISNYFNPGTKILYISAFTDEEEYTACPRMYGWDGETYQFVDSAASGRLLKRLGGTNYPATDVLTPKDGYYDLMVREPSYETSYLDKLELWAVDHPEGTEVIAEADGTIHTVSNPKTVGAVDSYGDDVTSILSARDGTAWNPDIRQKDFSDESQLQDWIELTLPDIPQTTYYDTSVNSGTAKLIVNAQYNHLSLLQIWSYYVYILGSPNHDELVEKLETDYEFAPYFDYGLWGCIAFQVEIWNGSEWTYYTDIKITDGPSHIAILNLSEIQGNKIRVSVPAGAFDIDYVAVDYSSDKPVTVTELQPAEAYQLSQLPSGSLSTTDVLQNISVEDGSYATLQLGDWLNYKFEALEYAPADGMTRSFVIPCTGYYIPEGPEVAEDKSYNWPLLEQISYEPLAFQKWVYPIYVDWLNQGDAYDCNDYAWHYVVEAPFPAQESLAWDHHSLNTDLVRVTVTYLLSYRTLTISAGTGGNVSPAAPGDYYFINTVVPVTATVEEDCYEFDQWTGSGAAHLTGAVTDAVNWITMDGDYTLVATFKETTDTYALTLTADPEGCSNPSIGGSSPFTCGADVNIRADAEEGCTFIGWTPTDGVADPDASDTTVHMNQARTLTAHFNGSGSLPTPTPVPEMVQESTIYLTQHVQVDNFRLVQSDDLIIAEIESGMNTSMGEYVSKTLTLYLRMRPSYQLPEESIWGEDSVSILGGMLFSGDYNSISGNVKVNATVTVDAAAEYNVIDGDLTCQEIVWEGGPEDEDQLSYDHLWIRAADNEMPDMGDPQTLFKADLSVGTTDWDEADDIHQYAFTGDVDFTDVGSDAYTHCWLDLDTHELKPGLYYSPGTITLATTWDGPTSGTVTFIADQIIISNGQDWGWTTDPTIRLTAYQNELLFWANGSAGDPGTAYDGDILILENLGEPEQGDPSEWHACASLEGVLFAPNGEIELAGSGAEGWFGYVMPAELYEGALIGQYLTLSGSHWNFYRW